MGISRFNRAACACCSLPGLSVCRCRGSSQRGLWASALNEALLTPEQCPSCVWLRSPRCCPAKCNGRFHLQVSGSGAGGTVVVVWWCQCGWPQVIRILMCFPDRSSSSSGWACVTFRGHNDDERVRSCVQSFTSHCTSPHLQIDCVSVIADDQATEPEEEASNDWSFQRGFN